MCFALDVDMCTDRLECIRTLAVLSARDEQRMCRRTGMGRRIIRIFPDMTPDGQDVYDIAKVAVHPSGLLCNDDERRTCRPVVCIAHAL